MLGFSGWTWHFRNFSDDHHSFSVCFFSNPSQKKKKKRKTVGLTRAPFTAYLQQRRGRLITTTRPFFDYTYVPWRAASLPIVFYRSVSCHQTTIERVSKCCCLHRHKLVYRSDPIRHASDALYKAVRTIRFECLS